MFRRCSTNIGKTFFISILILFLLAWWHTNVLATHRGNSQHCGNGVCQVSQDENQLTCPQDCGYPPSPAPSPQPSPTPAPSITASPTPTPINPSPTPGQATPTPNPSTSTNTTTSPTPEATPAPSVYPSITVSAYVAETNSTTVTINGSSSIETGSIAQVEYSFDGGTTWTQAGSTDGEFNSSSEVYTFTADVVREGKYVFQIRAKSNDGLYTQPENYGVANVLIVTTPPSINFAEIEPNPTSDQTPTISAAIKSSLSTLRRIEVSLDGGETWRIMKRDGAFYSYVPNTLEDGNYEVVVRAFDSAGNVSVSDTQTLVVDTIPPLIGGSLFTLGPQKLNPDTQGVVSMVAGSENTMVISMKGGVVKAQVKTKEETFDLHAQPGTSLWYGDVHFASAGEREITIAATDGANNRIERVVSVASVEDFGKVFNSANDAVVEGAAVSLYYYQPTAQTWYLWDGASYGQKNPQQTDSYGNYSFMVPPGRYYIEIKSHGYVTVHSEILDLTETSILNTDIRLRPKQSLALSLPFLGKTFLEFPTLIPDAVLVDIKSKTASSSVSNNLQLDLNGTAPDFALKNLANEEVSLSQYKGKNILLTFISSWSSSSLEQSPILSDIATALSDDQELVVVMVQESVPVIDTFMKRGKYAFPVLADTNGEVATEYQLTFVPQHFFIDKSGVVREVVVGVLDQQTALEKLSKLP